MGSFKIEKSGSIKKQATQIGGLLAILGIVVLFLWYPVVGIAMIVIGLIAILGGKFASS